MPDKKGPNKSFNPVVLHRIQVLQEVPNQKDFMVNTC